MSIITTGATVNIQFHFVYNDTLVDPDTITGEIFQDGVSQGPFTPTYVSAGVYNYSWGTIVDGSFELRLTGAFDATTPADIVHRKYFLIGDTQPSETLSSSYVICMLGELDPVYVDPEFILQYYPSGDLTEITEIIHRKSLDLESRMGCTDLDPVTALQHDYIVAATMCELSRIYGLSNSGLTGFLSAASFKLGDLEVDKGSDGGRLSSGKYDTGNAGSWCELAAVLKADLFSASGKLQPVVPGDAFAKVIPSRGLKSADFN